MYFFLIIFVLRLYVATADRTQHSAVPWFSILQRRGANKRAWLSSRLDHVSWDVHETHWSVCLVVGKW